MTCRCISDVMSKLAFAADLWIGASDKMAWQDDVVDVYDGGWSWSDGTPFTYVNWNSGTSEINRPLLSCSCHGKIFMKRRDL